MESTSPLSIILVEPATPGNIGAVVRAMANFGVSDLRLINPCNHLDKEAVKMAVFARPLLGQARIYPDLPSALADCEFSVAATRRVGHYRGEVLPIAQTADMLLPKGGRIALVFGREQSGLTTGEVSLCSHAACIETSPDGSLNLAQAVIVFLYEFARTLRGETGAGDTEIERPVQGDFEHLFATMERVLDRTAYSNPKRPEALMNQMRRIHQRSDLSLEELNLLRGVWGRLEESINDWPGRRK